MKNFGKGRESQQVRNEIEEGKLEYKEGQVAEFAGEEPDYEDDYGWEPNKPEVSEAESRANLEAGIEAAKEIIEGVKGDFIGARFSDDYYGYSSGSLITTEEAGLDKVLEKLVHGRDWYPLYDDTLAFSGGSSGNGSHFRNFIGSKEIDSSDYSRNTDAETFYYVGGKPVTSEDYNTFREEVRKMLAENYKNRGAEEIWKRQLPEDIKEQVKKMRFDRRTEQVLEQGKVVPAGKIQFRHIYGSSYFGSGGGYGSVNAFELSAWKKGERVKKEISTENGDNGFMSGTNAASIESNTIIIAKGGDCIGREGRSWEEIYICE